MVEETEVRVVAMDQADPEAETAAGDKDNSLGVHPTNSKALHRGLAVSTNGTHLPLPHLLLAVAAMVHHPTECLLHFSTHHHHHRPQMHLELCHHQAETVGAGELDRDQYHPHHLQVQAVAAHLRALLHQSDHHPTGAEIAMADGRVPHQVATSLQV